MSRALRVQVEWWPAASLLLIIFSSPPRFGPLGFFFWFWYVWRRVVTVCVRVSEFGGVSRQRGLDLDVLSCASLAFNRGV